MFCFDVDTCDNDSVRQILSRIIFPSFSEKKHVNASVGLAAKGDTFSIFFSNKLLGGFGENISRVVFDKGDARYLGRSPHKKSKSGYDAKQGSDEKKEKYFFERAVSSFSRSSFGGRELRGGRGCLGGLRRERKRVRKRRPRVFWRGGVRSRRYRRKIFFNRFSSKTVHDSQYKGAGRRAQGVRSTEYRV